jgi:hypothetical protein
MLYNLHAADGVLLQRTIFMLSSEHHSRPFRADWSGYHEGSGVTFDECLVFDKHSVEIGLFGRTL